MTEYAPASGQDRNPAFYTNPSLTSPHYTNGNGVNYFHPQYPQTHVPYSGATSYSNYPAHYMSTGQQAPSHHMYMPSSTSMGMQYHLTPPPARTYSQSRTLSYPPHAGYHAGTVPTQRLNPPLHHRLTHAGELVIGAADIESQDSVNEGSMMSEPILPPLEGYPDVKDFDHLVEAYVAGLSPKKRDKALINAKRARNIKTVLLDKKTTQIESAQFRFWVKKMFSLEQKQKSICHDHKPVAVREKLFKILTRAHKACQHGGRDKTSLQVRRVYSWVPKELISRFVKACPTCQIRRPSRGEDIDMTGCDDGPDDEDCPSPPSPESRRPSIPSKHGSTASGMPEFSAKFIKDNRWMTDLPESKYKTEYYDTKTKNEYYDTMNYAAHDSHDVSTPHYSARISQQLNNMSFSSADTAMTSPTSFPSSSVRSTGNWHGPAYSSAYSVKTDRHGGHIKQEPRM